MFRGKWQTILALCGALTVLGACTQAVFESRHELDESGLSYFLPKTLVTVKISAVGVKKDQPVTELTEDEKTAAGDGAVLVQTHVHGEMHSVLVKKNGTLVDDLITSLRIEVEEDLNPRQVADVRYNYVLQYQPSVLSGDRICLGVSHNSLLETVEAAVKDETGNIAVSIAKFAGRLAGPTPFTPGQQAAGDGINRSISLTIDPLDEIDLKSVGRAIDRNFPQFKGRYSLTTDSVEKLRGQAQPDRCPVNHVCYRTMIPVRLELKDKFTKQFSVAYAKAANRGVVNVIDVSRAFLVEKITKLKFAGGILESARIKKPSEGLELAKLPLTIYDAILTSALAAPGEFLGRATGASDAERLTDAIDQQATATASITDMAAQLEAIREDFGANETSRPDVDKATFKVTCTPTPAGASPSGG